MSNGKYNNLKDLVSEYISGFDLECSEIIKRVEEAYQNDDIDGHEYDDLMQYLED